MSDRNTGVFLPGHPAPEAVMDAIESSAALAPLRADAPPRVGHGDRGGRPYTHVALQLFEEGGFVLLDQAELPPAEDLELALGEALSRAFGEALYLRYDDELGAGGYVRFKGGAMVERVSVDGRPFTPVRRSGAQESALEDLDPSDWIWPLLGEAIEAGAAPLLGPGIRTDDDIEALLRDAGAEPIDGRQVTANTASPQVRPQDGGDGGRLRRLVHKLTGHRGRADKP